VTRAATASSPEGRRDGAAGRHARWGALHFATRLALHFARSVAFPRAAAAAGALPPRPRGESGVAH
jgi:hypothetical protein